MHAEITRRWNRFWFAADPPQDLAICRILFYGGLLALVWREDYGAWGAVSDAFWMPQENWPFWAFGIPRLAPEVMAVLSVVWKTSLALCCIGLLTRTSAWVAVLLGFYLLGTPHCLGDLSHGDAAAVLVMGVMAVARSGDALSLDRLIRHRGRPAPPGGEYRWPVRMVWLILSLVFFGAGYSKLSMSGLGWAFSDNMTFILVEHQFPPEHPEALVPWGMWFALRPWAAQGLALMTLVIETLYPLSMFSRRARLVLVPSMVLAVVGFRVLMGPSFFPLILCHVFWVPWWSLLRRGPSARPREGIAARDRAPAPQSALA